jgi:hypothetical protein
MLAAVKLHDDRQPWEGATPTTSKAPVTLRPYGQRSETVGPVVKADPDTDQVQSLVAHSAATGRQSPVLTAE